MNNSAIILTFGQLLHKSAKTAHGLIRDSERFTIVAVADENHTGEDAGQLITGQATGVPVYTTLTEALAHLPEKPAFVIVGANPPTGSGIPSYVLQPLLEAVSQGISVVAAMHEFVGDVPELAESARARGADIIDVRRPRPVEELHFWSGKVAEVTAPRIAVLGTDVRMGKRTTTRMLVRACRDHGIPAEMVYTGQTGWMQGCDHGFIVDSTVNDFIAGELEHAVHECWVDKRPSVIFIEGQGGLRFPPSPANCTYMTSVGAKHIVLQHAPKRRYYDNNQVLGPIGPIEEEIELIRLYGSQVIAVTLSAEGCEPDEARRFQRQYQEMLGIPVVLPLPDGVVSLVPLVADILQ